MEETPALLMVSVIIVHYRTPELLRNCLHSLHSHPGRIPIEVIVVDNSPETEQDASLKSDFPDVQWLYPGYNAGFARANNLGLAAAKGTYFLLLNPDTEVTPNTLDTLYDFYESMAAETKVGFVTCRIRATQDQHLLVGSGKGFPGLRRILWQHPVVIRLFRNQARKPAYRAEKAHFRDHEVDFASGAVLFGKQDLVKGKEWMLDEDFFLYWEDMEWCFRLKAHGFRHFFCAGTEILHVNAASTSQYTRLNTQLLVSQHLYYFKTLNTLSFWVYVLLSRSAQRWNIALAKRSGNKEALTELNLVKNAFEKTLTQIRKNYQRNVSSGSSYLKEDAESI